ncbi:hypothetical protein [Pseudomonas graminis]|uniref:hypothetical protein n=1 Tax=Pseudomonas graminis TaxID=158627 RepID=UPI00105B60B6|nr:hypothetical protein [Pseudomonas graminis]TDV44381.1 hypothetical protein EC919_11453 [Pseudomonas graminis]
MDWSEIARWAVPSLIVVLGWSVVSRGNDRRETRKEVRQFLDRTIASVENIRKNVIDCLTKEVCDDSKKLELSIDPELLRLEAALEILKLKVNDHKLDGKTLRTAVYNNGHYRVLKREKMDMDHRVLQEINVAAADLCSSLEQAYRETYQKSKFWQV